MKGSQIVCESLIREGVEVIFGIPGGNILPLYDAMGQYPQLHHVLMRHEQGSIFAADGYARATGRVGVCFASSGPGATNLVTGIASAYMDSSPIVVFTGQVDSDYIGSDCFQETDITGITLPITKYRYQVRDVDRLAGIIKEAFYLANSGRPGPVLIDIPRDVFLRRTKFKYPDSVPKIFGYFPQERDKESSVFRMKQQAVKALVLIDKSISPLILVGRGVIISDACKEVRELAERANIPVASTFLGLTAFPQCHPLSLGMIGMCGAFCANKAVNNADLVIAVGMRFDNRATCEVKGFAPKAKVIHIDIDPAEIGKIVLTDVPIVGDIKPVVKFLNSKIAGRSHSEWLAKIDKWRPSPSVSMGKRLLPWECIKAISEVTKGAANIVTGVGQHQLWAAQHFVFKTLNSFFSAGGLAPMGFGLPAAIGVKIACPKKTVWLIDGDGSFQMSMEELIVAVQEKLPIKIAIINNSCLGLVRQYQRVFFRRRYVETDLLNPDFVKIAEASSVPAIRVTSRDMVESAVKQAMDYKGPFLIDFVVGKDNDE